MIHCCRLARVGKEAVVQVRTAAANTSNARTRYELADNTLAIHIR